MRDRLLDVVAEESDRLAQIVNDVLLASHLDSGQLHMNIQTVDAARLTSHVVDAARAHLPEGITLSFDAPKRLRVSADEQQLRQVLVNLVENDSQSSRPPTSTGTVDGLPSIATDATLSA